MLHAVLKCSCLKFLHLCDICLNVSYIGAWLRMRRDCSNGMLLACILFNSYGLLLGILLIVAIHHKLYSHQLLLFFGKGSNHIFLSTIPFLFYAFSQFPYYFSLLLPYAISCPLPFHRHRVNF